MNVEQVTTRRFSMCLPLVLLLAFVLVASIPLAAGDNEHQVRASILLSRTEASPGDNFTLWIRLEPLNENARRIVIRGIGPGRPLGRVHGHPEIVHRDQANLGLHPG